MDLTYCREMTMSAGSIRRPTQPVVAAVAWLLGAAVVLVGASPASAGPSGGVGFSDPTGDGRPDIVAVTLEQRDDDGVRVKVRVRNVRASVSNALRLFVDPTGERQRPKFVYDLGIDADGGYTMLRTRGWNVTNDDLGTCGQVIRLREPSARVRVVVATMPPECFSDDGGAKFAVRTVARDSGGDPVGTPDWAPAVRTLTDRFER